MRLGPTKDIMPMPNVRVARVERSEEEPICAVCGCAWERCLDIRTASFSLRLCPECTIEAVNGIMDAL